MNPPRHRGTVCIGNIQQLANPARCSGGCRKSGSCSTISPAMTGMPEAIWLCRREKSPDAAPSSTPRLRSCPLAQRQRSVFGGSLADLFGLAGFQLLEPQLELLRRKILRGYAPRLLGTRERFVKFTTRIVGCCFS